jgi:septal ring factor EnvC (AmiA/AmiB activator)
MKKLFFFLSIVVLCAVIYIVLINTTGTVSVNLLRGSTYTADLSKEFGLPFYTILVLFAGLFSGAGVISLFLSVQQDKVKAYKRELEKTAVSSDSNASKVGVLEAKVKTLEKAFSSVVDERTKLEVQIKELNAEIDNLNKK